MKNLFEPATVAEVKQRTASLTPDSQRQWGTMNVAQAVSHCARSMEWAVGDDVPSRMLLGRILGTIIKPLALKDDQPMRRNSPTDKRLIVTDPGDFWTEQQRLLGLLDRFAASGPAGCTKHPHSFFGKLTPDEWAILSYKHMDHHLRQFGA